MNLGRSSSRSYKRGFAARLSALFVSLTLLSGVFVANASGAGAVIAGSEWVYVELDGAATMADVRTQLENVERALTGSVSSTNQYVALDIEGGFLAYVPKAVTYWVGRNGGSGNEVMTPGIKCMNERFPTGSNGQPYDRFASFVAGGTYTESSDNYSAYNMARAMGAERYWSAGYTGAGVDVVVIDTGTSPVNGLGSVLHGPDFSFESQSAELRHLDGFGHGTHMSGLVRKVAPNARIVSLKVGDSTGAADVTQVIAAIDWVREHKTMYGLNMRVINLSYGLATTNTWTTDELSRAVYRAWADGIVVVLPAGNIGDPDIAGQYTFTGVSSPAINKYALAIGAYDTRTDPMTRSDDLHTDFSNFSTPENKRVPDVAAPGAHVTGPRVANSAADFMVADALCENGEFANNYDDDYPIFRDAQGRTYVRGSGTSQSSALAAGAAALMLSKNPNLTPDQVKKMLKGTAKSIPNGMKSVIGDGIISLNDVFSTGLPTSGQDFSTVTGGGPLEGTRAGYHLIDEAGGAPVTAASCVNVDGTSTSSVGILGISLCGQYDIFGKPFVVRTKMWTDTTAGSSWGGTLMVAPPAPGTNFVSDPRLGLVWPSITWPGTNWAGKTWLTDNWTGVRWRDAGWDGVRWRDAGWDGVRWRDAGWDGIRWRGMHWDGVRWRSNGWSSAGWR